MEIPHNGLYWVVVNSIGEMQRVYYPLLSKGPAFSRATYVRDVSFFDFDPTQDLPLDTGDYSVRQVSVNIANVRQLT